MVCVVSSTSFARTIVSITKDMSGVEAQLGQLNYGETVKYNPRISQADGQ